MRFSLQEDLRPDEAAYVQSQLVEFADAFTGPRNTQRFGIALRNETGAVFGGVLGDIVWDWLQVATLWVAEELRGQGHGDRLLHEAEALGRRRGCRFARLSTWEFEAKAFYEARGYTVYGQLDDFPQGHTQYFLKKKF